MSKPYCQWCHGKECYWCTGMYGKGPMFTVTTSNAAGKATWVFPDMVKEPTDTRFENGDGQSMTDSYLQGY